MPTHSSILAWKIPLTGKPGLQSMGLQKVRHNLVTKQHLFTQSQVIFMRTECVYPPKYLFSAGGEKLKQSR